MEIYDEDTLNEFELQRQKNIIKNYEFMKACGKDRFYFTPQDYVFIGSEALIDQI